MVSMLAAVSARGRQPGANRTSAVSKSTHGSVSIAALPSDAWPHDPVSKLELVRAMIAEIDRRAAPDDDVVLAHMLASAWPSLAAQNQ
jgi:hypothetical protein